MMNHLYTIATSPNVSLIFSNVSKAADMVPMGAPVGQVLVMVTGAMFLSLVAIFAFSKEN
jgi:hypothetical protein